MADADRCTEKIWDLRCDQVRGHRKLHRAERNGSRVMWASPDPAMPSKRGLPPHESPPA